MDFTDIDAPEFLKQLKMFKEMLIEEHGQPEDDFTEIAFESMDLLLKELKGEHAIDKLSKDKKRKVYPHLALVLAFMEEIIEADEEFDEMEDFDEEVEFEEEEEEVEEHNHGGGCCQKRFIVDLPPSKPKKG